MQSKTSVCTGNFYYIFLIFLYILVFSLVPSLVLMWINVFLCEGSIYLSIYLSIHQLLVRQKKHNDKITNSSTEIFYLQTTCTQASVKSYSIYYSNILISPNLMPISLNLLKVTWELADCKHRRVIFVSTHSRSIIQACAEHVAAHRLCSNKLQAFSVSTRELASTGDLQTTDRETWNSSRTSDDQG